MNYILIWQSVLRRKGAYVVAKVVGFKLCGKGYNELVSEEVKRAVRDIRGEFPTEKAVFIVIPANKSFSGVLLFLFYLLLLNHFLEV